ncbi:MAG: hypothetical protein JSW27_02755 [Phycisphaerales bacterium]|nr:MAG: hypothetical protein JSW27_02755 [Phycisphaerales bacterium]
MKWSRRHVVWVLVILAGISWSTGSFADELRAGGTDASSEIGAVPFDGDYWADVHELYLSAGSSRQIISDDFDDNRQGQMWSLDVDNALSCWLDEANERLELRATSKADWSSAFYLAKGWAIDPAWDFSLRVDYKQEARLGGSTWLSVIVTPSVEHRDSRHVAFGVGTDDAYAYLWVEAIDESIQYTRSTNRGSDEGVLYISYDASVDELYISGRGYGVENAWATLRDVLQDAWAGQLLAVGLGGGSNGVRIGSGQAYLDNFVLEVGTSVPEQLSPVYRFWSPALRSHFYTIDGAERDKLRKQYADVWIFEGKAFHAGAAPFDDGLAPVYRFWSPRTGTHLYTIDEKEEEQLLKEGKDVWVFEGIAFYAYPEGRQPKKAKPVYRFSNQTNGAQFYTIGAQERDWLLKNYRDVFTLEGIGFYAYE